MKINLLNWFTTYLKYEMQSKLLLEMKRKKGRDKKDLYFEGSFYYFRKDVIVISTLQYV
jgi:hypothetical protein